VLQLKYYVTRLANAILGVLIRSYRPQNAKIRTKHIKSKREQ